MAAYLNSGIAAGTARRAAAFSLSLFFGPEPYHRASLQRRNGKFNQFPALYSMDDSRFAKEWGDTTMNLQRLLELLP